MAIVIEVRDARIPMSTSHPQMDLWLGNKKRILVLNREDMISTADRNAWAAYYARQGIKVVFSNGQLGMGTMKLNRLAKTLAVDVNLKRRAQGLLSRLVRAGIVGYPNVGKSSLINRLLRRKMCPAAPRPGVTRELRYLPIIKDGLEISQQALDPEVSEVHHDLTERNRNLINHRKIHNTLRDGRKCDEKCTGPPCTGFVEMMAPGFSKASWHCV